MNDENKPDIKENTVETKERTELIDSSLIKGLIISLCVYFAHIRYFR